MFLIAVVAALARAAQQGILIKGGIVLEALAAAKVITFDKTGTLTKGQTRVSFSTTYTCKLAQSNMHAQFDIHNSPLRPQRCRVLPLLSAVRDATNISVSRLVLGCILCTEVILHSVAMQ